MASRVTTRFPSASAVNQPFQALIVSLEALLVGPGTCINGGKDVNDEGVPRMKKTATSRGNVNGKKSKATPKKPNGKKTQRTTAKPSPARASRTKTRSKTVKRGQRTSVVVIRPPKAAQKPTRKPSSVESPAKGATAETSTAAETKPGVQAKDAGINPTPKETSTTNTADALAQGQDPFRLYMRQMSELPVLSREGEVEIAKRIEEGRLHVLRVLFTSMTTLPYVLALGDAIRAGSLRVRELVSSTEETDLDSDANPLEDPLGERVLATFDRAQRLYRSNRNVLKKFHASGKLTPKQQKTYEKNKEQLFFTFSELAPGLPIR